MQKLRKFLLTTPDTPTGVEYCYDDFSGLFVSVTIKEVNMPPDKRNNVIVSLKPTFNVFFDWAKKMAAFPNTTVVEMADNITFEMLWNKYNDKIRSSKKRSEKLWQKLSVDDRVKAFYYIDVYNKNRGNAEKKYCNTYLNDELWNN